MVTLAADQPPADAGADALLAAGDAQGALDAAVDYVKERRQFGKAIADFQATQFRLAETEKYPHVTFFLNGGREVPFPGEDRVMPKSPKVATYDLQPEMSSVEVSDHLVAAIDKFQLQRGTAIGNGIVVSLAELFPDAGIDIASMQTGRDRQRGVAIDQPPIVGKDGKEKKTFVPVAPGSYASAAIILLTDGQRTTGVDSMDAAKAAADRGVRIYTVGIGTVDGETIGFEGWSMRVKLDEETLKGIARNTQAEYFYAGTASDLKKVYESLSSRLTVVKKETEISGLLALVAAVLALLSAGLSLAWFNRIL